MRSSPSFHYQLGVKISIDLALGCKLGDATGGAFRDFDFQTEDKKLSKADKDDGNSVQECFVEDRVCNVQSEKLVGAVESSDAACNLYIPLVFSTPFSNNNSDNGQFLDEINASRCMKGGISNFASHDRDTGCLEWKGFCSSYVQILQAHGYYHY